MKSDHRTPGWLRLKRDGRPARQLSGFLGPRHHVEGVALHINHRRANDPDVSPESVIGAQFRRTSEFLTGRAPAPVRLTFQSGAAAAGSSASKA